MTDGVVLATKLFPPAPRSELVARPRLAERLAGTLGGGHRLTLVSAPAGFGKTALLGDWTAGRERVGWLSLDEGDNALPRFLAHLVAALAGFGIDVDMGGPGAPPSATMTALVNELVRAGQQRPDEQWLLVLDDYHVIDAPEVHEAVTFLLDHAAGAVCTCWWRRDPTRRSRCPGCAAAGSSSRSGPRTCASRPRRRARSSSA